MVAAKIVATRHGGASNNKIVGIQSIGNQSCIGKLNNYI